MWNEESQTIPSWLEGAYEILVEHADDISQGIHRDLARDLLLDHEDFEDEPTDATYAIDQLLERGWLYEVNGKLFATEPDR